jgi:RNA polymerase sigma-70 factor (ECF subfamily)
VTVASGPVNEDVSIVRALRAREPHAGRVFWTRFAPLVFRVLHRTIGPDPDNEDLAQDVFLTVLRRVHALRDPSAFGSFVCSVAQFAAREKQRGRFRSRRLGRRLTEVSDGFVTIDVEGREALLRFAAVLTRLRPEARLVFALRRIEGMDLREMASVLGVSLATVKRRLQRARKRLAMMAQREPALRGYRIDWEDR